MKPLSYLILFGYFLGVSVIHGKEIPTKESAMLWLGTVTGEIHAKEEKIHLAATSGDLLFLKKEGEKVTAYEHFAIANRERLLLKEKNLGLTERGLEENLSDMATKVEDEGENVGKRLEEFDEEILKLKQVGELSGSDEFSSEIQVAIKKVEAEKKKLELKFNETFSEKKLSLEKEKLLLQMETQRFEMENLRLESYLKAEVDGTIQYLLEKNKFYPDSEELARVNATDPLVLIRNDESVYILVPESSFERPLDPRSEYFARVTSDSGMRFTAHYLKKKTVFDNDKPITLYVFEIGKGDLPTARNVIHEKALLNVMQKFENPVMIVEKEALIKADPLLVKEKGWEATALQLFPVKKILAVGKGSIALQPK